jgi:hypothetical protein
LTVTRTNLTNLTYNFQLTDKDNKIIDVNAPRPGDEAFEVLKEISGS